MRHVKYIVYIYKGLIQFNPFFSIISLAEWILDISITSLNWTHPPYSSENHLSISKNNLRGSTSTTVNWSTLYIVYTAPNTTYFTTNYTKVLCKWKHSLFSSDERICCREGYGDSHLQRSARINRPNSFTHWHYYIC